MNFKEHLQNDISTIFVNLTEFASQVIINGVPVSVVEDNDQLLYRITQNYNGLVVGDILFYITSDEWAKIPRVHEKPVPNQAIVYAGRAATVINASEQDGIFEVILQSNGGGF